MSKSVWRRAAELVDVRAYGCCQALQKIENGTYDGCVSYPVFTIEKLQRIFKPQGLQSDYWWEAPPINRTACVLALLLMEQIEQDEQRERKP